MKPLAVPVDLLEDLGAVEADPGLLPEGEHLPEGDAEHPGVGGVAELAGLERLRRAPGEGDLLPLRHDVAVVLLRQGPHQAEVTDLHPVH